MDISLGLRDHICKLWHRKHQSIHQRSPSTPCQANRTYGRPVQFSSNPLPKVTPKNTRLKENQYNLIKQTRINKTAHLPYNFAAVPPTVVISL